MLRHIPRLGLYLKQVIAFKHSPITHPWVGDENWARLPCGKWESYDWSHGRTSKALDLEYLEDKSQWFKLTKLYTILNGEGVIPDGMTVRQFWTGAHKMLKSFEPIYIKTVNSYSQYPSTVVLHYKVDYLVDILKHLTNQHFINGNQLISELQSHNIESETKWQKQIRFLKKILNAF